MRLYRSCLYVLGFPHNLVFYFLPLNMVSEGGDETLAVVGKNQLVQDNSSSTPILLQLPSLPTTAGTIANFSTVVIATDIQAIVDRYLRSLLSRPILAPPQSFTRNLSQSYTMKPRLVSCPPTTEVNSLPRKQAFPSNQVFLIICCLVMNIKVRLVYPRK